VRTKGKYRLIAPLPRRRLFIYIAVDEGRGQVLALQDPTPANGYEAVISVRDGGAGRGSYNFRAFYSLTRPKEPEFIKLIRVPNAPGPHYTRDGRFLGPAAPKTVPRSCYSQDGRFWGEKPGPVRSLINQTADPAFHWKGEVDEYAVLAFDGKHLTLLDCGLSNSRTISEKTSKAALGIEDHYLILSECSGRGRVRVIQPMNVQESKQVLIEVHNPDVNRASRYILTGYLVPKGKVDEFYRPRNDLTERCVQAKEAQSVGDMSTAASHWAWIAAHTKEEQTRLWAIEKFCMLQPYPGPNPNPTEDKTLTNYQTKESLEILLGKNMILPWPKDYTARVPTKWRFLAELDICMEWLKVWTGRDSVRLRKKRMISRFRIDQGATALYVSFRLHIPRKEMRFPPDHGPYSHEVSHGFVGVGAIAPTGRFNEGLTEVARTSYWHFLGLNDASVAFRGKCLVGLVQHMFSGGSALDAPGYAGAAALYFVIMDHFCRHPDGNPDWHQFTKLFNLASEAEIDKNASEEDRWRLLVDLCGKAFGKEARLVLKGLGMSGPDESR